MRLHLFKTSGMILTGILSLFWGLEVSSEEVSKEFNDTVEALLKQLNSKERSEVAQAYSRLKTINENNASLGAAAAGIAAKSYHKATLKGRGMILRYLAQVPAPSSVKVLATALENEEVAALRAMAARGLLRADSKNKESLEKITEAVVNDPDEYFQLVVLNSLAESLSRESIPYMIRLLKNDATRAVNRFACQTLKRCTRQRIDCNFDEWDTWWTENQDIFVDCSNKKKAEVAPSEGE
ncbi:MAG: HEAT repeat domain-containing protein [Planctomycetota bacterium]|nr:HEAT repeat domain-containing protein [Planctomycetota bacterium]MDP6502476.1 HEAT repeat domain-containing protein [Planctomycetota bacterium]